MTNIFNVDGLLAQFKYPAPQRIHFPAALDIYIPPTTPSTFIKLISGDRDLFRDVLFHLASVDYIFYVSLQSFVTYGWIVKKF